MVGDVSIVRLLPDLDGVTIAVLTPVAPAFDTPLVLVLAVEPFGGGLG
jgi:hypothetical protein